AGQSRPGERRASPHRLRSRSGRAGGRRRAIQAAAGHPRDHPAGQGGRGCGGAGRAAGANSMKMSPPFIARAIPPAPLMVGLLLGGLAAYPLLPIAALPNVNYPTLQVTAQLPGADPQTMGSSVATPLETQFGQIPGLTQMTSSSALGYTQITLQFDLSRQ